MAAETVIAVCRLSVHHFLMFSCAQMNSVLVSHFSSCMMEHKLDGGFVIWEHWKQIFTVWSPR